MLRLGAARAVREHPAHVIVDNSCTYPASEQLLRFQGIWHFIPERCNQRQRRSTHSGRPLAFDGATYGRRNVFESCVNKLRTVAWIIPEILEAACRLPDECKHRCADDLVG